MLVDGSGLSGPSGVSGEMAGRYLRKICVHLRFFCIVFVSIRGSFLCVRFFGFAAEYCCGKRAVA